MMIKKRLKIKNKLGLHARAAAKIVSLADTFAARLTLERDGLEVDGRSILGILTLACEKGSFVTATACGEDAADLAAALESLFNAKFDEE